MLTLLLLPLAVVAGCDKVPLLAPTGTVITLIPAALNVANNSELQIMATVIENGVAAGGSGSNATRAGAGTPVQNGTLVTFTTTIGRIEPAEARTHNGQVSVRLITDGRSGSPIITAFSGGASASTKNGDILIGAAAVGGVGLSASPQTLGSSGGSAQLVAFVGDDGGGPLPGIGVSFNTTKGTVSPAGGVTDANGIVVATLSTTATADVTASAGSKTSAKVTVTVSPPGIASFTASPTATTAGTLVSFTVTPTAGANLTNVRINFGDGRSTDLGGITAASTAGNTYCSPGNYTATATAFDAGGGSNSLNTSVIIGALPITLSAAPPSPLVLGPTTFTVGGVGSAQVSRYVWTFDDGTGQQTTSAPQNTHTFTSKGIKNVRVDVFGVVGCQIGSAQIAIDVQ